MKTSRNHIANIANHTAIVFCLGIFFLQMHGVAQASPTVTDIAAGHEHSLFVRSDGTLWTAGNNNSGELGDGTTTSRSTPMQVASDVVAVAAGGGLANGSHSLFVKSGGSLWAMGYNGRGQLGDSTTTNRSTPVQVASDVKDMAAGAQHSLFVKNDGTLCAMGNEYYGQLGNGSTIHNFTYQSRPVQVDSDVVAVAVGMDHSLFVKSNGTLWAMGYNNYGQLGDNTTTDRNRPVQVASDVKAVAAAGHHSLFVKNDGTLWAMGHNDNGQLGDGTTTAQNMPVQVASDVVAVAAGSSHSLFVKNDDTLWAMGRNNTGQLGDSITTNQTTPVQVTADVKAVAAAGYYSLFVKNDGTPWAMGSNYYGQLGDSTTTDQTTPVPVHIVPIITTQPQSSIVIAGQSALFTIVTVNDVTPSYEWQILGSDNLWTALDNDATYSGVTTASLTVANVTVLMSATQYRCFFSNILGTTFSETATLTIATPPAVTVQPESTTADPGQNATFTIVATGTPAPSHQWQILGTDGLWMPLSNNTTYDGVATASLTIVNVTTGMTGAQYRCALSNMADDIASNIVTLTVGAILTAPAITTHPVNQIVPPGENATFNVAVSGDPAPTLQWQSSPDGATWTDISDATGVTGATTATLTLTAVTVSMNGTQYRCLASNSVQSDIASAAAALIVNPALAAPAITTPPANQTVTAGQNATFTVAVSGNPAPTLQWQSSPDGATWTDIPDVTGTTLTFIAVTTAMNGTQYRCLASNSVQSDIASAAAALIVNPALAAPTITTPPANQTVTAGQNATFTVAVSGNPTPTLQWQSSPDGATWTDIPDVTGTTLTFTAVTTTMNGTQYRCLASNSVQSDVASTAATLTVNPDPATAAAQQLKNQLEDPGVATVTVTGAIDLSLVGGATITSGKTIVGADAASTITGGLTLTAGASGAIINGVNFAGGALTIAGANDVDVSHCTFTDTPVVINGGADNIAFSWNKFTATSAAGAGGGSAMRIDNAGATTGILLDHNYFGDGLKADIPAVTNARVVMFNNYIATTGNTTATIAGAGAQILSERNIYQNAANPLAKQGTGKLRALDNFTNATTGTPDPGTDIVFVPAYSRLMYPAGSTAPLDAAAVATLITTNAGNTAGKNSVTPPASVTNAAASIAATVTGASSSATATAANVTAGDGFTLTASATNFTPVTRQWYLDNFAIPGTTASTHTVTNATAADAGAYAVALTTPAGEIITSAAFTVTVGTLAAPVITTHPASQTITAGGSVTFNVTATGQSLTYQWQKNSGGTWTDIPNATAASYTITNARQSEAASYRVLVSNPADTKTSAPATLTVNAAGGNGGGNNNGGNSNSGGGGGGAPGLPWLCALASLLALRAAKRR